MAISISYMRRIPYSLVTCYYLDMNQTIIRIVTGLFVILLGVGALLDAMNVFHFWEHLGNWWPLLMIAGGILLFLANYRQYIGALALILIGIVLQLNTLEIISVNIWSLLWPVIIIAVGLSIVFNHAAKNRKSIHTQDLDAVSAVFGGNDSINKSKDYKGGKVTAVFGGVTIDLRDAVIKKEATIEVLTICGGVELKVPKGWTVKHSVFPILGGVENKVHSDDPKAPVLYITGTLALGGVEIKY
jgi:predicted membrane protein